MTLFAGFVELTVGGSKLTVNACTPLFGLTELSVGRSVGARLATPLHPATKMLSRNTILRPRGHTLLAMYVRICVLFTFSNMVPPSRRSGRRANSVAFQHI